MSALFLTTAIVFALISIPIRHNLCVGLTQLNSNEAIVLVKKINETIVLVKIKPSEVVVLAKNNTNKGMICTCWLNICTDKNLVVQM